jgi:predicted Fe-Mo cluster-binding NifX family protein
VKIAVASVNGSDISSHFGQSRCFIIFDAADGKIAGREVRDNTFTAHAKGECAGGADAAHRHDHAHSHAEVVAALEGCDAVLCGGMGWRAAEDLKGAGIRPVVVADGYTPETAVQALLDGSLKVAAGFCRCHE